MQFESFSKRLGRKLAKIRTQQRMTQVQLAAASGLSLKYITLIEAGANPTVQTVMRVCEALGAALPDILEQAGIGTVPGRRPANVRDLQMDIEEDDPQMRRLFEFLRRLDLADRRRALRLLKAAFKTSIGK